jgi:hypothetical protein
LLLDFGFWIALAAVLVTASGCNPTTETKPATSPSPAATSSPVATPIPSPAASPSPGATVAAGKVEAMVGRWTGADGKYVNITKKGDKYSIEVPDAAGPKTYDGTAKGEVIEFTRNGKTETLKAASGSETGIKRFEKETNCVVITKGSEAYCKK